jgi:hypothetical protein
MHADLKLNKDELLNLNTVEGLVVFVITICDPAHLHDLSKNKLNFLNKHLLISLQLNKTCLLQSTPSTVYYMASKAFPSPGTRFAG